MPFGDSLPALPGFALVGLPFSGIDYGMNMPLQFPLALILMTGFLQSFLFGRGDPLAVGAEAPRLTVTTHEGTSLGLDEIYEAGLTLIYFYPRADTPGCTAQACSLRDAFAELTGRGVTVLGVSGDSVEAQKAFRSRHNLPFTLIADTDQKLMNAFGVPHRAGFAARQAFLIDRGTVVWRDLSASTRQQADDVLQALAERENSEP